MAELQEDDVMPNDGTYFGIQEPEAQSIGRKKEKAETLQALPILKDLLERMQKRVDFYGSVDAIPDEVKTEPDKFLITHNANELTRDNLRSEIEWISGLLEEHAPNR
jgi:hypothetical protein